MSQGDAMTDRCQKAIWNFQSPIDRLRKKLSSKTIQVKLFMLNKETVLRQNSKQSTIKFSFVSTQLIRLLTAWVERHDNFRIRKRKNEILTQSYLLFCVFYLQTFLCGNQEDLALSEAYVPRSSLHFRRSLRTFLWRTDLWDRNWWTSLPQHFEQQEGISYS